MAWRSIFVICLFLFHARLGSAAAPCTDIASCEQQCHAGKGSADACRELGDLLAAGAGGTAPNHARAAELYALACGGDPTDSTTTTEVRDGRTITTTTSLVMDGDPESCLALAELVKTGWLFEVERDFNRSRQLLERAQTTGANKCVAGTVTTGCATAARAAAKRNETNVDPNTDKSTVTEIIRLAETGCKARDVEACEVLSDNLYRWKARGAIDAKENDRLREVMKTAFEEACLRDGEAVACIALLDSGAKVDLGRIRSAVERPCANKDQLACMAKGFAIMIESKQDKAKMKQGVEIALASCDGAGHEVCDDMARSLAEKGIAQIGLAPDPKLAATILTRRCNAGSLNACLSGARLLTKGGTGLDPDKVKAKSMSVRACSLTSTDTECELCREDREHASCKLRRAYEEHAACYGGRSEMCEVVGRRFREANGVPKDHVAAARHFRRGCDGAQKNSCAALDDLCIADTKFDRGLCHQSLIHSDLFYEAEWQFRTTGVAKLGDDADKPTGSVSAVAMADASASAAGGASFERGHLDADLVVSVVLDRARQAAIELVVSELAKVGSTARSRYLHDLLAQGAALLADPTTLRREKFQDLGMTVVRAFVASNLVDTLFPTVTVLYETPVIGAVIKANAKDLGIKANVDTLPAALHSYLVDIAYELLAAEHLFASTRVTLATTKCPLRRAGGAALCKVLADPNTRAKVLQVSKVLDGIRMAKALRDVNAIDLRRLVEALTDSLGIADLDQTPGLVLRQWRIDLIEGSRARAGALLAEVTDLTYLLDAAVYAETGADLAQLTKRADSARRLLLSATGRVLLGRTATQAAQRMVDVLKRPAITEMRGTAVAAGAAVGLDLATVRKRMLEERNAWADSDVADTLKKLKSLETTAKDLRTQIDQLETAVYTIETTMKRFRNTAKGTVTFDVTDVPLHAISDLRSAYVTSAYALRGMKDKLLRLFPGTDQPQIEFALSATVRLLGFFNLMERLARATRLTQTCGDVVAALRVLGAKRNNEFAAPLYDVLEPVLSAIKTHEPMSIDLLFAVIARARLDSLVSSLQGGGNACEEESSVDCWTVKVVHALQESVERTGGMIHVDGGKFAKRLASHGDDFRHRHRWRGYFHLTVGLGGLRSKPVEDPAMPAMTESMRNVPLISEQVGFGLASPSFWNDHMTFKVGAAASGLLYRAVVDSQESKALMIHPIFFALDISNLVEAYVSPLTLLLYPPTDTTGTQFRLGVSAGLQVPLSAYLERL